MLLAAAELFTIGNFPIYWWQIPLVLLLIGLIIFWKIYRSKQM